MKKLSLKIWSILLIFSCLFITACSSGGNIALNLDPSMPYTSANAVASIGDLSEEVRGVWIASVYNINFPSSPDLSDDDLKGELDNIVDTVRSYGMNTVFFQVHPASDALYRSELFPVSKYLFSDGILHFDPLDYMSTICKENGISLYAWINPLRVSVSASDSVEDAKKMLPSDSPGLNDDLTVFYGDGKLYLDCGNSDTRELVAKTVDEIMIGYDIDGVVFDDYFYPYPAYDNSGTLCEFDDSESYNASKTTLSIEDWRRENVNKMVKQCYEKVKSHGTDKKFGVAPFGIWQNNNGTNNGSDTSGMEAFHELYCDASAWIKDGYVDFISPQLYWECSNTTASFEKLTDFWNKLTDGTNVDLIISHGIYQYDGDWTEPSGELIKQIETARAYISYKGSLLYGYDVLKRNINGASDDTKKAFSETVYYYSPSSFNDGIILNTSNNVSDNSSNVTFCGFSDPNYTLTVNGDTVSRKQGGYFECVLDLNDGKNSFIFKCGDKSHTVNIVKNTNS